MSSISFINNIGQTNLSDPNSIGEALTELQKLTSTLPFCSNEALHAYIKASEKCPATHQSLIQSVHQTALRLLEIRTFVDGLFLPLQTSTENFQELIHFIVSHPLNPDTKTQLLLKLARYLESKHFPPELLYIMLQESQTAKEPLFTLKFSESSQNSLNILTLIARFKSDFTRLLNEAKLYKPFIDLQFNSSQSEKLLLEYIQNGKINYNNFSYQDLHQAYHNLVLFPTLRNEVLDQFTNKFRKYMSTEEELDDSELQAAKEMYELESRKIDFESINFILSMENHNERSDFINKVIHKDNIYIWWAYYLSIEDESAKDQLFDILFPQTKVDLVIMDMKIARIIKRYQTLSGKSCDHDQLKEKICFFFRNAKIYGSNIKFFYRRPSLEAIKALDYYQCCKLIKPFVNRESHPELPNITDHVWVEYLVSRTIEEFNLPADSRRLFLMLLLNLGTWHFDFANHLKELTSEERASRIMVKLYGFYRVSGFVPNRREISLLPIKFQDYLNRLLRILNEFG